MPALLLSSVVAAAEPPLATPVAKPSQAADAALLELAKGQLRGAVVATARAALPGDDAALLVATQPGKGAPVSFLLLVFGADGAAGYSVIGHDEVRTGPVQGAPLVSLAAGAHLVAAGSLTATVGWRAADGSSELQTFLYRQGAGRLTRLLAVEPDRSWATASGRPSLRHELGVLPTVTGGFHDLRVRTRECAPQGECSDPFEVTSYTFDGVKYAPRPFAVPFVEAITASSELASSGAIANFSGSAAIDGRPDTAWCEGAPGAGWFQKLELSFMPAQRVKAISIFPGGPRDDTFTNWTRPKRIRVVLPDNRKVEADLADEQRPQRIALPESDRIFGLTVVIVDVFKGKREDACINELELEVEP